MDGGDFEARGQAKSLLRADRPSEAEAILRQLTDQAGASEAACVLHARCLQILGRLVEALAMARRAAEMEGASEAASQLVAELANPQQAARQLEDSRVRQAAKALLGQEKADEAERTLAGLTAMPDASEAACLLHAQCLKALGRTAEAVAMARRAASIDGASEAAGRLAAELTREHDAARARADMRLRHGAKELLNQNRPAEAERLLRDLVRDPGASHAARGLYARALHRMGRIDEALTAAWAAARLEAGGPSSPDASRSARNAVNDITLDLRERAKVLMRTGRLPEAEALMAKLTRGPDTSQPLLMLHARCLRLLGRTRDALTAARRAFEAGGGAEPLRLMAELMLEAGGDGAEAWVEQAIRDHPASAADLLGVKAEALAAAGRNRELKTTLQRIMTHPEPDRVLARLLHGLDGRGLQAATVSVASRLRPLHTDRLQGSLRALLDAARASNDPVSLPQAAVSWAWELADRQRWTEEEWLEQVHRGERERRAMDDWWRNAPERAAEFDELIAPPDLGPLLKAAEGSRGLVLASAHLGTMAPMAHVLQTSGLPFRALGRPGLPDRSSPKGGPVVVAMRQRSLDVLGELVRQLRSGAVVGVFADSQALGRGVVVEVAGRPVVLSTWLPKLLQALKVPSMWAMAGWQGSKVVLETAALPQPEPGEPPDRWARRWCEAYARHLEKAMAGDPRNLQLGAGLWRPGKPRFQPVEPEEPGAPPEVETIFAR